MSYISVDAITINSIDAQDRDRYVLLFTDKFGKLNVKFKSVRSANSRRVGLTQDFTLERILLYKKGTSYIATEATLIKDFPIAKTSSSKIFVLLYIKELMMLFVPFEQEDIGLFNFLIEILSLLNQSEEALDNAILLTFLFKFFEKIGYPIAFNGNYDKMTYFSLSTAGFNDKEGIPIKKEVVEEAYFLAHMKNYENIAPIKHYDELIELLNYYVKEKFEVKDEFDRFLASLRELYAR